MKSSGVRRHRLPGSHCSGDTRGCEAGNRKAKLPMRRVTGVAAVIAALLFAVQGVESRGAAATISVRGDVLNPEELSVEGLRQRFAREVQSVKFTSGEGREEHVGTGIPLLSLLQATGPRTGKVPKHYDLTFLVILEALDHYRVFFSLAELLPSCGHADALLVWEVDGKPLPQKEAPLRLVVSSDHGSDRNIYGIASVTLVDGTKLANQLTPGR
jgi:DMSO/TMAO reductase YedYZ molybdopterin-dependent catalytic subunit